MNNKKSKTVDIVRENNVCHQCRKKFLTLQLMDPGLYLSKKKSF